MRDFFSTEDVSFATERHQSAISFLPFNTHCLSLVTQP
jgi:hypothetical protein